MVIGPLVVLAVVYLEKRWLRRIGTAASAIGLVGLLALFGWAVVTWEARYGTMTGSAIGLRFIYLLATGTELPVVQIGLAGAFLRAALSRGQVANAGAGASSATVVSTTVASGRED